jgi:hypothetical protein
MKVVNGRFGTFGLYVAAVSVETTRTGDIELRLAGKGKGSRGVRLTASDARVLAYALLSEAERALQRQDKSS